MEMPAFLVQIHFTDQILLGTRRNTNSPNVVYFIRVNAESIFGNIQYHLSNYEHDYLRRFSH